MTLAKLGAEVAASPQYIHKLESTLTIRPTDEMLRALSNTLGFDPKFFFSAKTIEFQDEDFHFRRRSTTPLTARNHALANGSLFAEMVAFLENELSLPEVMIPQASIESTEEIERIAESCRIEWGLLADAPIKNLTRALERVGIVVAEFVSLSPKVDAFSWSGSRPIIVRSTNKNSPSRSRYDLAHECGHLVLHAGHVTGDATTENQANYFAGALLLPRAAFAREYPRSRRIDWISMFRLKQRWGVSVAAIVRRAYNLQLIDAATFRRACVHIRRKGWDKGEPMELEPEHPEIIRMSFDWLFRNRWCYEDIAATLGWSNHVLKQISGIEPPVQIEPAPKTVSLTAFRNQKI